MRSLHGSGLTAVQRRHFSFTRQHRREHRRIHQTVESAALVAEHGQVLQSLAAIRPSPFRSWQSQHQWSSFLAQLGEVPTCMPPCHAHAVRCEAPGRGHLGLQGLQEGRGWWCLRAEVSSRAGSHHSHGHACGPCRPCCRACSSVCKTVVALLGCSVHDQQTFLIVPGQSQHVTSLCGPANDQL